MSETRREYKDRRYVRRRHELSADSQQFNEDLFETQGAKFLRIPMSYYRLMTADEAQVLAYLWWKRDGLELADLLPKDGAFYVTVDSLGRDLNIPASRQQRIFQRLKLRGYVKIEHRGMPKKRYASLNRKLILIDVAQTYDQDVQESVAAFRDNPASFSNEQRKHHAWGQFC
jgi:hypothetical protein